MGDAFVLNLPLWEILARGSLGYIAISVILRLVPKRQTGNLAPNDMIALVIIGTLGADAIIGEAQTLLEILLLVGVVVIWDYLFNLAEFHLPVYRKFAQHPPTLLIYNGVLLSPNMRKEKLTEQELRAHLRMNGIIDISQVKQAILEADGQISIVEKVAS